MMKSWVKRLDELAEGWLPLSASHTEMLESWARLHGWKAAELDSQRLLVRQALLNALIRQTKPELASALFATPLDVIGIDIPTGADDLLQQASSAQGTTFWSNLYNALIPQARRRYLGQFWTDEQTADWMTTWLLQFQPHALLDVGCGPGTFLIQAKRKAQLDNENLRLAGFDISPLMLNITRANLGNDESVLLTVHDYLYQPLPANADAIICNPPYTRHHDIPTGVKDHLQSFLKRQLGQDIPRQGTLAFYFLLKLIAEMQEGARAAVIVPMEVLDARYGKATKKALRQHTTISALVHFSPEMNAFHKVDVGASILLFRKGRSSQNNVCHLTLRTVPTTESFLSCLDETSDPSNVATYGDRRFQPQDELLDTQKWFSAAKVSQLSALRVSVIDDGLIVPLKILAKVVRGIATGANEFFVLSMEKVQANHLQSFVVRTIQRNRDIQDIVLDEAAWQSLSSQGKGVWLLYLNGDEVKEQNLRDYLSSGERQGYHLRSLVQTRRKWYSMEQRDAPPIFFTILTRGNPRFILNQAGVRPLNMFSLIYPNRHITRNNAVEILWALLNTSFSTSQLHSISRTYGGKTLKVEPRELDNLPVINPLALLPDKRRAIEMVISEFHQRRDTGRFLQQMNSIADQILATNPSALPHLMMPLQARLIESLEAGFSAPRSTLPPLPLSAP